jgi:hypothetical protein
VGIQPGGLETGLATTLGPQRRLSRSICRRRRPQLQEDSSEPRRGQGSALTVSSRVIGGEMPRVRKIIRLELLDLFYRAGIHCVLLYDRVVIY